MCGLIGGCDVMTGGLAMSECEKCPHCESPVLRQNIRGIVWTCLSYRDNGDELIKTERCKDREIALIRSRLEQVEKERDRLQAENAAMRGVVEAAIRIHEERMDCDCSKCVADEMYDALKGGGGDA
jgi:hypothetical protein